MLDTELQQTDALFELIDAAVREILRHEDPDRFLDWMRANARRLLPAQFTDTPDGGAAAAISLGRALWNVTPLPANHFQPKSIPDPGRNDPCPCGSGRKFKQCCAQLPRLDVFTTDEVWPILVSRLSRTQVDAAVSAKRIPPAALAAAAQTYLDDDMPNKAAALLEPVFETGIERLDERFEVAFDLLCDVYAEQSNDRKRERFAERIAQQARGPLARAAWLRLAAIRHDAGRIDEAWDAIRMAHQADPGDPTVGLNELTLLVAERRLDEAAARAKFWAAKLSREQYPDDELIEMFRAAARDGQRRPSQSSTAPGTADLFAESPHASAAGGDDENPIFTLHSPESLAALEQAWHRVFPCAKPLLTDPVTNDIESAWTPEAQADWIAFLERRPEAADSLDILDDVAGAVLHVEWELPQGARSDLAARIVDRSCAIVERAIEAHPEALLPWAVPQNRSGLRALARRIGFALEAGDNVRICECADLMLGLNPDDNHGFRGLLVNSFLRRGMDAEATALVGRYPRDASLEMQAAAILLALRRGDLPAATACLQDFIDSNRHVLDYLLRPNSTPPKGTADGSVMLGSRQDAWEYCEAARDVWTMTPGALEWLRRAKQSIRQLEAERKATGETRASKRRSRPS